MKQSVENQPLFIFGCTRGGTTLLRLMLNTHSKIAIPPESHFLIPIFQKYSPDATLNVIDIKDILEIIENHPRFQFWNIDKEQLRSFEEKVEPSLTLSELIDRLFRLEIKNTKKPIWGDKTPEYWEIIPEVVKLFPKAYVIAYTRDGRDVAISLKKRGWKGWIIYQRAKYWKETVEQIYKLKDREQTFFLKYEDLVLEPQKKLLLLCDYLSLEFEPKMLDYNRNYKRNITKQEQKGKVHEKLGRKPKSDDIERWRKESSKFEIWKFESVAYRALSVAGYGIEYYRPNNIFHKLGRGFYFIQGEIVCFLYWSYYLPIFRPFKDWIKSLKTTKI